MIIKKYGLIIFGGILLLLLAATVVGVYAEEETDILLQGQVETSEVTISGTLPGRITKYYVAEGDMVQKGDTLVMINSPQAEAKYNQVKALERATLAQNEKIDAGTRLQLIEMAKEVWIKSKADLELALATYKRMQNLYSERVITLQRKEEMEAVYKSAVAAERAAYNQYEMAKTGFQIEDKATAYALVMAAQGGVEEVVSVLKDGALTSPVDGQVGKIYLNQSELVGVGTPLLNILMMEKSYLVFNVREDLMPHFSIGKIIYVDIPAIAGKRLAFGISYISPLGSFATWKSTKQRGSYDLKTFEIRALPVVPIEGLRPGMSALLYLEKQ